MNKKPFIFGSIFLAIIAIIGIAIVAPKKQAAPETTNQPGKTSETVDQTITISEETFTEKYFSVKMSKIQGSGTLATAAQNYINDTVKAFGDNANSEVPERIKEYGEGNPGTNYGLELLAVQASSPTTRSIIINGYDYRGGANGNSFYKTFTESTTSRNLITLKDVIAKDMQDDFAQYAKKKLLSMQDNGIFSGSVEALTFESFDRWSIDTNGNLILYFDRSEIAAGAAGAIKLFLPRGEVSQYSNPEYK